MNDPMINPVLQLPFDEHMTATVDRETLSHYRAMFAGMVDELVAGVGSHPVLKQVDEDPELVCMVTFSMTKNTYGVSMAKMKDGTLETIASTTLIAPNAH